MISVDLRRFTYDDDAALADIAFTVGAGERLLIVGESGAGKTTLARVIAGQFDAGQGHRFTGSITVAGQRLAFEGVESDPRIDPAAWAAHVGYVGQRAEAQLSMVCATVAEEIAFGLANHGVPAARMHGLIERTAQRVGLTDLLDRDPRRLSGGELQRVCLAAAVVNEPGLLVLDEPFKGLDAEGRRDVQQLLETMVQAGTAILQFEPLLPAGTATGQRIRVLAGGTLTAEGPGDLSPYGADVEGTAPDREPVRSPSESDVGEPDARESDPPAVRISGLSFSYGGEQVLSIADLAVQRGEAVAVLGRNGSGKSTLLQQLNGLLRPTAGTVTLHGKDIAGRSTGSLAPTVGYLFQDSDQQLFERTVLREVTYGPRAVGHSAKESARLALHALREVGLAGVVDAHPHDLCFRDRRLVALASLMATGPNLWVLDEPTVGLDVRGRDSLTRLIRRHTASGGTMIMATHDDLFAQTVCSRAVRLGA